MLHAPQALKRLDTALGQPPADLRPLVAALRDGATDPWHVLTERRALATALRQGMTDRRDAAADPRRLITDRRDAITGRLPLATDPLRLVTEVRCGVTDLRQGLPGLRALVTDRGGQATIPGCRRQTVERQWKERSWRLPAPNPRPE